MIKNIAVFVIGLVFFAAGVLLLVKHFKSKKNCTSTVMGEVISYITEERHDSDSYTVVYYPVFRYYAGGKFYENKSDIGRGKQKYTVGEKVELLYDAQNPDDFVIAGDNSGLFVAIISTLIGIGVVILSFFAEAQ